MLVRASWGTLPGSLGVAHSVDRHQISRCLSRACPGRLRSSCRSWFVLSPCLEEHVSDDIEQLQARSSRSKPAVVTALDLRVTCCANRHLDQSHFAFLKAFINHRMSSIAPSRNSYLVPICIFDSVLSVLRQCPAPRMPCVLSVLSPLC